MRRSFHKLDLSTGLIFDARAKDLKHPRFQAIVGLEIHAQLNIPTKLFSDGIVTRRDRPNSAITGAVHPYDVAVPGFLPVLSRDAVRAALIAAQILQCEIATLSRFERKHYTYADMPFYYQITQQRWPLAVNGKIEAVLSSNNTNGKKKTYKDVTTRINRIQLEQDSGKTVQAGYVTLPSGTQFITSRVDFNRAGQALIEIVTEPDLRTPLEASTVTDTVRKLLKHAGICDGRMEEGSLRCDVNVNIEELPTEGDDHHHTNTPHKKRSPRVEVKNIGSIRQVREAVEFEALRQANEWKEIEIGTAEVLETRRWNPIKKCTELVRTKHEEQDYRFLPEPDMPPLVLNDEILDGMDLDSFLQKNVPELPSQAVARLQENYEITEYQARVIAGDPPAIAFFDKAISVASEELRSMEKEVRLSVVANSTTNFLTNKLFSLYKEYRDGDDSEASIQDSRVSAKQLGQVVALQLSGKISKPMAKRLLEILYKEEIGGIPAQVVLEKDMEVIADTERLRHICSEIINLYPKDMNVYRKGDKYKSKITKFFAGKVMEATKGNAEPEILRDTLAQVLEEKC